MSEPTVPETKRCSKCGVVRVVTAFKTPRTRTCSHCKALQNRTASYVRRRAAGVKEKVWFTPDLTEAERFWSKVSKDATPPPHVANLGPCWLWLASKTQNGYGIFYFQGRLQRAHRVAWILNGAAISGSEVACHRCDVRACVNPDHLFIGTAGDNVRDCRDKGRLRRAVGERSGNSKLTELAVTEIRNLRGTETISALAARFGVERTTIRNIMHGRTWQHL